MDEIDLLKDIFKYKNFTDAELMCFVKNIPAALETIAKREKEVITKRLSGMTYKSIGQSLVNLKYGAAHGICVERTRQIYKKAICMLRHGSRIKILIAI